MKLQSLKTVIHLGSPPDRIDIMTSCDGCHWAQAWRRREIFEIDGLPVPVISLGDLLAAKAAAGRYKDLEDLENLT